jgi:hypothetical protein
MTMAETSRPPAMWTGNRRRRDESQQGLSAVLARVNEAMQQEQSATMENSESTTTTSNEEEARSDPAPSVPALAQERVQMMLANISNPTLSELRELREQIDALMHDMNDRRDMISEAIRSHAEFSETTIQAKIIIAESLGKMRAAFDKSRTPLPPVHNLR